MNKLWSNKTYSLDCLQVFSKPLLNKYITIFWDEIVKVLPEDKHILLILRIQYQDNSIVSIGNMQKLNKGDIKPFIKYILEIINTKTDHYVSSTIINIICSYGVRNGLVENQFLCPAVKKGQTYYGTKFPISFNPLDYGRLIHQDKNKLFLFNDKPTIIIKQYKSYNEKYNLVEYYRNNILLYKWKDIYINETTFTREIGKSTYRYENNKLILHQISKNYKFLEVLKSKGRNGS